MLCRILKFVLSMGFISFFYYSISDICDAGGAGSKRSKLSEADISVDEEIVSLETVDTESAEVVVTGGSSSVVSDQPIDEEGSVVSLINQGTLPSRTEKDGLSFLNLNNTGLTNLMGIHQIKDLETIQGMSFFNNRIGSWRDTSLATLHTLRTLDLEFNHLENVFPTMFSGLKNLTHLNVSDNKMNTLSKGAFRDLPNLIHLNLSRNKLNTLTKGTFGDLPNLTHLDLSHNGNSWIIGENAFGGLTHLTHLNLSVNHNELLLSSKALSGLSRLTHLDLSYNRYLTLPANLFEEVINLKELHLACSEWDGKPDDLREIKEDLINRCKLPRDTTVYLQDCIA